MIRQAGRFARLLLAALLLAGCALTGASPTPAASPSAPQPTLTSAPPPTETPTPQPTPTPAAATPAPTAQPAARAGYVVVIVLDGGRPDYFELAELPNLRALMQGGTVYADAWTGALDTDTIPGHVSLSTGVFPARHGLLPFNWLNLRAIYPEPPDSVDAVQQGILAEIVAQSGLATLAGLVKQRYPDGKVAAVSATKAYAALALGLAESDYVLFGRKDGSAITPEAVRGHVPPQAVLDDPRLRVTVSQAGDENLFAARAGIALLEAARPRALLLNFSASDIYGHSSGGKIAPKTMARVMQSSDQAVGELVAAYRQAGIFEQTLWVVTSDHGMIPNSQAVDPQPIYDAAAEAGIEGQINAPYSFLPDTARALKLAEAIAKKDIPGVTAVYYKLELRDGFAYLPAPSVQAGLAIPLDAAYRYLLSTFNGPGAPDVVLMTAEDMQFSTKEPNSSGSHGWIAWGDLHIPLILSGAGIAPGTVSGAPARLVDLLPTIAILMGLPGADWDGLVLADALQQPLEGERLAQDSSNELIAPLRDTLKRLAGKE